MATENPRTEPPARGRFRHWIDDVVERVKHDWRPTLFVTACVTLLHLGTAWLDALEGSAYVAVANAFVTHRNLADDRLADAVVVEIDDDSFDTTYARRSPLNRTALLQHLEGIYSAKPEVVVIDLDLSPALPAALQPGEAEAEAAIKKLILDNAANRVATARVATVLLEPFPTGNAGQLHKRAEWMADLKNAAPYVSFGWGDIPVRYGMTSKFFADEGSLYSAAHHALEHPAKVESAPNILRREKQSIDPRVYRQKLRLVLTSASKTSEDLRCAVRKAFLTECDRIHRPSARPRVVYFGAAFGGDDLFNTPLGRLYGVEMHAGAFASGRQPHLLLHVIGFAIDLILAFLLGDMIARAWRRHSVCRISPLDNVQRTSGIALFNLSLGLTAVVILLMILAGLVLGWWGVWISPAPIAIGMFIEAWVVGSTREPAPPTARTPVEEPDVAAGPSLLGIFRISAHCFELLKLLTLSLAVLGAVLLLIFAT